MRTESSSLVALPIRMAPSASRLTCCPVRPNSIVCMGGNARCSSALEVKGRLERRHVQRPDPAHRVDLKAARGVVAARPPGVAGPQILVVPAVQLGLPHALA